MEVEFYEPKISGKLTHCELGIVYNILEFNNALVNERNKYLGEYIFGTNKQRSRRVIRWVIIVMIYISILGYEKFKTSL